MNVRPSEFQSPSAAARTLPSCLRKQASRPKAYRCRLSLFAGKAGKGLVVLAMLLAPAAHALERLTLDGRNVAAWMPKTQAEASSAATAPGGTVPVILFSHGFGGCNLQSVFLMEALAADGYAVFAPNHKDANPKCAQGQPMRKAPVVPFEQPAQWNETTYRDRAEDLRQVLSALAEDKRFASTLDFTNVGLVGHSLGGYTVLGMAGGWPSWAPSGRTFRAVLTFSAYAPPYILQETLKGLNAPVMYQGGTQDFLTPRLKDKNGAYDQSPAPKYYVEFTDAGHLAWTGVNDRFHALINRYSLAFLDHYMKGEGVPPLLTTPEPGVADLRFANETMAPGNEAPQSEPAPIERKRTIRERLRAVKEKIQ